MANQSDELRVVIMKQPHVFGMRAEYVNPLLLYYSRITEEPDCDSTELVIECFQFCKSNVEQKHYELTHPEVSDKEQTDKQIATTKDKNSTSNSKAKGKFPPKASSNGTGITSKQLRYLGYLWRQLGEEPNYDEIGKLTQIQATMRIKTLEDKLGLTS
jgi:hypothetical protein